MSRKAIPGSTATFLRKCLPLCPPVCAGPAAVKKAGSLSRRCYRLASMWRPLYMVVIPEYPFPARSSLLNLIPQTPAWCPSCFTPMLSGPHASLLSEKQAYFQPSNLGRLSLLEQRHQLFTPMQKTDFSTSSFWPSCSTLCPRGSFDLF